MTLARRAGRVEAKRLIYVNYCSADSPVNFKEAIGSDESSFWVDAMNKVMNSLKKNKTWELVEKPKNKEV